MRLAFVIPWYGPELGGGAEQVCRELALGTARRYPSIEVHVLTTALRAFAESWNENVYREGEHEDEGVVRVHRFNARPARRWLFSQINRRVLTRPPAARDSTRRPRPPLPAWLEPWYLSKMVQSPGLEAYLRAAAGRYDWLVFLPYLYGTTVAGMRIAPERAVMIPCLHDERYAYLRCYEAALAAAQGLLFHVRAEQRLANRLYRLRPERQLVLGAAVDTDPPRGDAERFRRRFGVRAPFLLYAGRRIVEKNVPYLVECVRRARKLAPSLRDLELVLIGPGDLSHPRERHPHVRDLGFVSAEDKHDAYAAALALCQPSLNESFSIVLMEAWLQGTPCLVAAQCEVTRDHVADSGGGLTFADAGELAAAVARLHADAGLRAAMAARGRAYVLANYDRARVLDRFVAFLDRLRGTQPCRSPGDALEG